MTDKEIKQMYSSADYRGLTDKERRIFQSVIRDNATLLRPADAPMLASYARNVNLARKAAEEIEQSGVMITVVDRYHGERRAENPAVGILQRAQAAYESTGIKLGITPTGRKRLKGEGTPVKDEADEFIEGLL